MNVFIFRHAKAHRRLHFRWLLSHIRVRETLQDQFELLQHNKCKQFNVIHLQIHKPLAGTWFQHGQNRQVKQMMTDKWVFNKDPSAQTKRHWSDRKYWGVFPFSAKNKKQVWKMIYFCYQIHPEINFSTEWMLKYMQLFFHLQDGSEFSISVNVFTVFCTLSNVNRQQEVNAC